MKKLKNHWMAMTLILVVLLCSIASYVNRSLPAYIDKPADIVDADTVKLPELSVYQSDTAVLSFSYPSSFTKVTKSGNHAYLAPDGSYVMLQETGYDPKINMATESTLQAELLAAKQQPVYFEKLNTSAFLLSYRNGAIFTWEYVSWDLDTEYRLIFSYGHTAVYEELAPYIMESFQWEKENPIPEDVTLVYSEIGDYEFASPAGWNADFSNGSYIAVNPETSSQLCVTAAKTKLSSLSDISELQYLQEASQSRVGLSLRNYGVSGNQLTAEAVYRTQTGEQIFFYHVMYLKQGYLYEFLLDTPYPDGNHDYESFLDCLKYFRSGFVSA